MIRIHRRQIDLHAAETARCRYMDNLRRAKGVSVAIELYGRFRPLIHEFAKFGIIGVVGLVITNGGYDVLHNSAGMGPVKATTVATIAAMLVAYIGNRYWSFRYRERTGVLHEAIVFFVLNGMGLLIQVSVVGLNYYVLGLRHDKFTEFVALNIGIAAATLFRFWSYRKWIWLAPAAASDKLICPQRPHNQPLPSIHLADAGAVGEYHPPGRPH